MSAEKKETNKDVYWYSFSTCISLLQ